MLFSCAQNESFKEDFELLINQEKLKVEYSTSVTYDSMLEDEDAIFGTLLLTGYLTLDSDKRVFVPNKEVLLSFILIINNLSPQIQSLCKHC